MLRHHHVVYQLSYTLLLLLLSSSRVFALRNLQARIANGETARKHRFPYYTYLRVKVSSTRSLPCSGVLIHRDLLLSAAHCLMGASSVTAYINATELPSKSTRPQIVRAIPMGRIHPKFKRTSRGTLNFDIAMLKLDAPVDNIQPIVLNANNRIPQGGDEAVNIGLGELENEEIPTDLQEAVVTFFARRRCNSTYFPGGVFSVQRNLCAGGKRDDRRGSCPGDSGAPLILEGDDPSDDLLLGLVSWGKRPCGKIPTVYTRISSYRNWIMRTVCRLSSFPPDFCDDDMDDDNVGPPPGFPPGFPPLPPGFPDIFEPGVPGNLIPPGGGGVLPNRPGRPPPNPAPGGVASGSSGGSPTPRPTPQPTRTRTPPSPPSMAPPPVPSINPGIFCFSRKNLVDIQGRGLVEMHEVRIGDFVRVSESRFERIYSFGHRNNKLVAEFLQLLPSGLELTRNHLLLVDGKGFIPASQVRVGDQLSDGTRISMINILFRKGIYSPFTPSGVIVVNGIVASNYISLQGTGNLKIGSRQVPYLSHHWLNHSFQLIHRLWCHYLRQDDRIGSAGLSSWVSIPLKVAQWVLRQNHVVMALFLAPFVISMCILHVIELGIMYPIALAGCIISILTVQRIFCRKETR